jgi:hypothetical protein
MEDVEKEIKSRQNEATVQAVRLPQRLYYAPENRALDQRDRAASFT